MIGGWGVLALSCCPQNITSTNVVCRPLGLLRIRTWRQATCSRPALPLARRASYAADLLAVDAWSAASSVKWRHGHHFESMMSYQKCDCVTWCVEQLLAKFYPNPSWNAYLNSVSTTRTRRKEPEPDEQWYAISSWSKNSLNIAVWALQILGRLRYYDCSVLSDIKTFRFLYVRLFKLRYWSFLL